MWSIHCKLWLLPRERGKGRGLIASSDDVSGHLLACMKFGGHCDWDGIMASLNFAFKEISTVGSVDGQYKYMNNSSLIISSSLLSRCRSVLPCWSPWFPS